MKTVTIIGIVLSLLMLGSIAICGLWIRAKGADPASIRFHITFGLATVSVTVVTLILAAMALRRIAA